MGAICYFNFSEIFFETLIEIRIMTEIVQSVHVTCSDRKNSFLKIGGLLELSC